MPCSAAERAGVANAAGTITSVTLGFELARTNTALDGVALAHARRLMASWQVLADLCFADLLFLAPIEGEEGHRFVVLGQVRPTTDQTLYTNDMVGTVVPEVERPLISRAWREGEILEGEAGALGATERARIKCIPVRCDGSLIGIITRETPLTFGRRAGSLERQYFEVFDRFARMIGEGSFPFPRDEVEFEDAPRVADGVIILDGEAQIRFASPNAISSLHRMGIHAYASGQRLSEIGFDQDAVDAALTARLPVTEEVERGDTSILMRAIPLLEAGDAIGAVVLMRDVTDLRRRDRMLLSKDATIREIHHRVKNNLQTIAALLRLQGRRLSSEEAQEAIEESERRIRSIAIVHETLSRDTGDVVPFGNVVKPLVRTVEETVSTPEVKMRFEVSGNAGNLRGDVATALAVVLNELMQNAVDHAFPRDGADPIEGKVLVRLARLDGELVVEVIDDGIGLPAGFTLESSKGLGLSIVQALVSGELGGSMELGPSGDGGGTHVRLRVPVAPSAPVEL
jgi:two-component system, sensor histidine kinase PdtaS